MAASGPFGRKKMLDSEEEEESGKDEESEDEKYNKKKKDGKVYRTGAGRFLRLYFSPRFIPQMHSMHSDVSLSVWRDVTS